MLLTKSSHPPKLTTQLESILRILLQSLTRIQEEQILQMQIEFLQLDSVMVQRLEPRTKWPIIGQKLSTDQTIMDQSLQIWIPIPATQLTKKEVISTLPTNLIMVTTLKEVLKQESNQMIQNRCRTALNSRWLDTACERNSRRGLSVRTSRSSHNSSCLTQRPSTSEPTEAKGSTTSSTLKT